MWTDGIVCSMCNSITFNSFEPNHSPKLQKKRVKYIDHCCFFYYGDITSAISFQQIMKALFITLCLVLFKLWCQIQIQTGDWSSRYPVCKHMNREAAWGKAGPLRSRDGLREEEDAFA